MYDFLICIVLIESMSSVLYHISIPPESLPCVTPLSLVDGKIIYLNPIGQPVDKSLTFHVSYSIIISEFRISLLKSECWLLTPKMEDLEHSNMRFLRNMSPLITFVISKTRQTSVC